MPIIINADFSWGSGVCVKVFQGEMPVVPNGKDVWKQVFSEISSDDRFLLLILIFAPVLILGLVLGFLVEHLQNVKAVYTYAFYMFLHVHISQHILTVLFKRTSRMVISHLLEHRSCVKAEKYDFH